MLYNCCACAGVSEFQRRCPEIARSIRTPGTLMLLQHPFCLHVSTVQSCTMVLSKPRTWQVRVICSTLAAEGTPALPLTLQIQH